MTPLACCPIASAQCTTSNGVCCADLTGDGLVTHEDLGALLADYDCDTGCCVGDITFDGKTDSVDLALMLAEIGDPNDPNHPPCSGRRPVPLVAWDTWDPNSIPLPLDKNGVSFADFNVDGLPDAACWIRTDSTWKRRLYFNFLLDSPSGWREACLLPDGFSDTQTGYGVVAGDYNNDGFPDYANEPRYDPNTPGDEVFLFLVNAGCGLVCDPNDPNAGCGSDCADENANFLSVAACLGIEFDMELAETNCMGDADGDGDIDLLVPAYNETMNPPGDHGTFFFQNLGHDPNYCSSVSSECQRDEVKIWRLIDATGDAGLTTLRDVDRPEGAQLVDYDCDGDLDVFVQDVVLQNYTVAPDYPTFRRLFQSDSGVEPFLDDAGDPPGTPEEGLLVVDIDMDGDLDLVRNYWLGALHINLGRGDGTHESRLLIQSGNGHGLSAADWDNDGDLDLTLAGIWLRNTTVEGWLPIAPPISPLYGMLVALGCPDPNGTICGPPSAIPSWADVDLDGDLDCARSVYQDITTQPRSRFYRNHLYLDGGPLSGCDESGRRYVNVRPVRAVTDPNGPTLPEGRDETENEFGAKVEIVVRGDAGELRRVQCTSSAAGYLTQNAYELHFGLPGDPDPNDPNEDLHFDAFIDFVKPLPEGDAAEGPWRIDWTVNTALGDINLADLYPDPNDPGTWGRRVTVYRDGRVRYAANTCDPIDPNTGDPNGVSPARMYNLCGPLLLPEPNTPLPDPNSAAVLAGVRFVKDPNTAAVRIREIVVDGQLDDPDPNSCEFNIVVLDVTDPNSPEVIGALDAVTAVGNRRTFIPIPPDSNDPNAFILPETNSARVYDLRVRVTNLRSIEIPADCGLEAILGISSVVGLSSESSTGKDICQEVMVTPMSSPSFSPVTARLSRKAIASP